MSAASERRLTGIVVQGVGVWGGVDVLRAMFYLQPSITAYAILLLRSVTNTPHFNGVTPEVSHKWNFQHVYHQFMSRVCCTHIHLRHLVQTQFIYRCQSCKVNPAYGYRLIVLIKFFFEQCARLFTRIQLRRLINGWQRTFRRRRRHEILIRWHWWVVLSGIVT